VIKTVNNVLKSVIKLMINVKSFVKNVKNLYILMLKMTVLKNAQKNSIIVTLLLENVKDVNLLVRLVKTNTFVLNV